jgi:hypothetical protein
MPFTLLSGQSFSFSTRLLLLLLAKLGRRFDKLLYMAAAAGREASIGSSPSTTFVVG